MACTYIYENQSYTEQEIIRLLSNPEGILSLTRNSQKKILATEIATKFFDRIAENVGFEYHIITEDQAREITKDAKNAVWNGEGAFFFNGKAYILDYAVTLENGIHELSHPLVKAVMMQNRPLFDNLYNEIIKSNEGATIDAEVRKLYPVGFSEDEIRQEVVVRGLTIKAEKNLTGMLNRFWAYIRQMLRRIFGKDVRLENLSEATTLQELADMLTGEGFKIDTKVISEKDVLQFNRDTKALIDELNAIGNSKLVQTTAKFNEIIDSHLKRVLRNKKYEDLKLLSTNETERNQFVTMSDLLKRTKDLQNNLEDNFKRARQLAHMIEEIDILSAKMFDRVGELIKTNDPKGTLNTLSYYGFILGDWGEFLKNFSEELMTEGLVNSQSEFLQRLDKISSRIKNTETLILKNDNAAVLDLLSEMLEPVKKSIDKVHKEKMTKYQAMIDAGDKSGEKLKKAEEEAYKRKDLSKENLERFLQGKHGDANAFTGFLEAYISSEDPIIGGFARYLKTHMYNVENTVRGFANNFAKEIKPLYKTLNVSTEDVSKLANQLTFQDTILAYDEDGKLVKKKVITFLNPFKDFRHDRDVYEKEIAELDKEGNKEALRAKKREYAEWQRKYMHQKFHNVYYELQDIWKTDIGEKANEKRQEIFKEIEILEIGMENNPTLRDENLKQIKMKWDEYSQLSSLYDKFGELKNEEDTKIANVIKEYQEKSREIYEFVPKKGLFETRLKEHKQILSEEGLVEGTDAYRDRMDKWLGDNTRIVIKPEFYKEREEIFKNIAAILSKLPENERKQLEAGPLWETVIDLTKGFRNDDGQPQGLDMHEERIAKIKNLQDKIFEIQDKYEAMAGLDKENAQRLDELYEAKKMRTLSQDETDTLSFLLNTKSSLNHLLGKADALKLKNYFQQLKMLQSKIPTDQYLTAINEWTTKLGVSPVEHGNVEVFLYAENVERHFTDGDFKKWFLKNHIKRKFFDKDMMQEVEYYQRVYVWNVIKPNKEEHFDRVPKFEYFKRRVRDKVTVNGVEIEMYIKPEEGKTTDNKGNWLPKTPEQGAPKDTPYINERYYELKRSNPKMFELLEVYTKYHRKAQEGLNYNGKLWMDVPRYRKERLEYLQSGKAVGDTKDKLSSIQEGLASVFKKREDDFAEGVGNFLPDEQLVTADLFNNEINKIPITGLSNLPLDQISLDIGGGIIRYMLSAETNRVKSEMAPMWNAVMKTLKKNGVEDLKRINRFDFFSKGVKTFVGAKDGKNVRLQILTNLYDREFRGIENRNELGETANKTANALMRLASWASLAFDLPGSVKNLAAGRIQNTIETMKGQYVTYPEYLKGTGIITNKYIPAFIKDYNELGTKSFETQLFDLFDPVQGKFVDDLGRDMNASKLRDTVAMTWAFAPRAFGELQVQGSLWAGMMLHVNDIEQKIGNETKKINYLDAWEFVDGEVRLKAGIDPKWGPGGAEFNNFKLKLHELNQRLQGNYAAIDQAEMNRYTTGRLLSFMRKYLVPGVVNRFSKNRVNYGLGDEREGYYRSSLKIFLNMLKTHKVNWHLYSDAEKAGVWKTTAEVTGSLLFYFLLRMLGWDEDDDDKIKKLADNNFIHNHLIYQIMAVKSESEQFIPIPGMGFDELVRLKNTPSIAFGQLDKYYRVINDAVDFGFAIGLDGIDTEELKYKKRSGIWEKGDYKILAHTARLFGLTGTTFNPEVAIENYYKMSTRTK